MFQSMHGLFLQTKNYTSTHFTYMPRPPAIHLPSEFCRSAARPGRRCVPLTSFWRRHEVTLPAKAVAVRRGAPATSASVLQCDHDERKGGDMPNAITCAGVPPMIHLHHMLPSWPVGRWEHGIPGHRRTFSAWQRGRSGGAAMGVGLQKERRGSAAD